MLRENELDVQADNLGKNVNPKCSYVWLGSCMLHYIFQRANITWLDSGKSCSIGFRLPACDKMVVAEMLQWKAPAILILAILHLVHTPELESSEARFLSAALYIHGLL